MLKKITTLLLVGILIVSFVGCSTQKIEEKQEETIETTEKEPIDFGELRNEAVDKMVQYLNNKYGFGVSRNNFVEIQNITTTNESYINELLLSTIISDIDVENYRKGEIEICTPYLLGYFNHPISNELRLCVINTLNMEECYDDVQYITMQKLVWESIPSLYIRDKYNFTYSCRSKTLYSKGIDFPFVVSEKIDTTNISEILGSDKYKDLDFDIHMFVYDEEHGIGEVPQELQDKFNSIYRFAIYNCKDESFVNSIDSVFYEVVEKFVKDSADKISDTKTFGYNQTNKE